MRSKAPLPTPEEWEWMGDCKSAGCLACWLNGKGPVFAEYNHAISGNKRRGHMFGYALCTPHHRGLGFPEGQTYTQWKQENGPSLAKESKAFRDRFGSDNELIEMQRIITAKWRECNG